MRTVIVLLTSLLLCMQLSHAQRKQTPPSVPPRYKKVINSNWTFNYFPDEKAGEGYESPGFDDSKWTAISIPHTWTTYETTGEVHPFIRSADETDNPYWRKGWGWYRKHFTINSIASGKKVFIEFAGVQKYCKVWINGKFLGDHTGTFGFFDFDISALVTPGKDNLLAVAVRNNPEENSGKTPSTNGDINSYSGIRSDVTLVIKDNLYILSQGSASHEGGIFITTPSVSEKEAVVRIQTPVQNDYPEPKECILNTYITDASGRRTEIIKSKARINPGQRYKFDQKSKPLIKPHLWSPDDPYLYEVRSEVLAGNSITDICTSPLGFRLDAEENNISVNDKKVLIHGGNRHQEYPWLGEAIPKWITETDPGDIAENLVGSYFESPTGQRTDIAKVRSGEPARIVLKSSHNKIDADRASVVIITADIVDSEGNHVSGATNTIKWSVTGPATLVGHNVYEPDINRHNRREGVWYTDMPVPNVIRSAGVPGRITVLVSAPGLASGSVTLEAVEEQSDNSIITEPVLNDEGRRRVFRPEMSAHSLEESQGELKRISSEINLGKRSEQDYKAEISRIILNNNPLTDTTTIEYKTLVSLFTTHLLKNSGVLTADDCNFNTGNYNNCRVIAGYINPLKLPPLFKDWLRKYYSEEIILRGNEKNAGDEMNWLNWIPSGGTVVVSQSDKVPVWPKGTIITTKTDLADLITAVHPVFAKYSPEAKERALIFIGKMNPYVKITETTDVKDGKKVTNFTYIAEKSKPVLIPLIKFISE